LQDNLIAVTFAFNPKLSEMILKRSVFSLLFFTSFYFSNAQFKQGMRMVGVSVGNIFYNSGKSDYTYPAPTTGFTANTSSYGISLSPSYGWFISDNTVIGASFILGYNHKKTFYEDGVSGNTFLKDEVNTFNIGIGGFVRNYFSSSGNFYPFGQFGINFGPGSANTKGFSYSGGNKSTYTGKGSGDFFANAGLTFGLTKKLSNTTGLDLSLGYNFSYEKSTFKTTTLTDLGNNGTIDQTSISEPTQKFTNHGVSFSVGFQVYLEGKK